MNVSVIQRVVEAVVKTDTSGRRFSWFVRLACGHAYEVADGYHSEKVCARWCFTCEKVRDGLLSFGPPDPRRGA